MTSALLHVSEVSEGTREMFIYTSYRPMYRQFRRCWRSVFQLHNETLNIWTHALPLLYFIYSFIYDEAAVRSRTVNPELSGSRHLVLYGYVLGLLSLFAASSFAHIFNCLSSTWRDVCFMLDYAAISLFGMSSAALYFYIFRPHCDTFHDVLSQEEFFLSLTVFAGLLAMVLSCWTRLHQTSMCHVIRTGAYVLPFLMGSIPAFGKCLEEASAVLGETTWSWLVRWLSLSVMPIISFQLHEQSHDVDVNSTTTLSEHHQEDLPQSFEFTVPYLYHVTYLLMAAVVNMSRVPERLWPGKFDVYGHSHQWFHVLIFMGIREQFWFIMNEISKNDAHAQMSLHPTYNNIPLLSALYTWMAITVLISGLGITLYYFGTSIARQNEAKCDKDFVKNGGKCQKNDNSNKKE